MDVSKCTVKLDHSVGSPEPATNWRQAVGFPVYGVGQPTEEGFVKITEKLNSKEKVITYYIFNFVNIFISKIFYEFIFIIFLIMI